MPATTRTFGPLHLEDLDPRRFEDLVRQLLYDFRSWRTLEATGRSGADDGFDARGWEQRDLILPEADLEGVDADVEEPRSEDRMWLVQCKRERAIGPSKLTRYLDDIPALERPAIYGIVFAAACDFSKTARDDFRDKARSFGFSEVYLWGKGEIEDQLFQPKNDHLLFAYFGISLQARRRTLKTDLRARLIMKRKAVRLINTSLPVLIRDASDDRYPYLDQNEDLSRLERGRWRVRSVEGFFHDGIWLADRRHLAYIDEQEKHWDFYEGNDIRQPHDDPWDAEPSNSFPSNHRTKAFELWDTFGRTKAWLEQFSVLPYENIIDIDERGDEFFSHPHIYTVLNPATLSPYRDYFPIKLETADTWGPRSAINDPATRVCKFEQPPQRP